MSAELVERAAAWMAERASALSPHAAHARLGARARARTASEAVQIAAVTHDAERAYPDRAAGWDSAVSWADPEYNRWHQERCAQIVAEWLREQRRGRRAERGGREARAGARGGRLARGRHGAGRRLALVPRDDGRCASRVGPVGAGAARERPGQGASLARAHQPRARGRAARRPSRCWRPPCSAWRRCRARQDVLAANGLIRQGRILRLARDRFPRMPVFPGHPSFEVLSYRTPQGMRAAGDRPWGPAATTPAWAT